MKKTRLALFLGSLFAMSAAAVTYIAYEDLRQAQTAVAAAVTPALPAELSDLSSPLLADALRASVKRSASIQDVAIDQFARTRWHLIILAVLWALAATSFSYAVTVGR